jgi:hypothetical protein
LSYPKSIDTLVADIYKLFDGHDVSPENAKVFGDTIAELITRRLGEKRGGFTLRMSSVGKPDRQLWYDKHSPETKEPLPSNVKFKFLFGDIIEAIILFLAKEAGHTVENEQRELVVNGVVGHTDGTIDGTLIDVKSASTFSFKKFKEGSLIDDDPFGYLEQLAGYNEDVKAGQAGFVAVDKTLGHITFMPVDVDYLKGLNVPDRIEHLKEVLEQPEPPERCYDPVPEGESGNLKLNINCSYCDHKFECWKDANNGFGLRTFLYSKGPTHLVHIEKEPRVIEITF